MTPPYPHLDSVSDLLKQIFSAELLIRSSTHSWVVTRHQYGISSLVPQTGKPVVVSQNSGSFLNAVFIFKDPAFWQ